MKTAKLYLMLIAVSLAFGCSCRASIGTNLSAEKVKDLEFKKKSNSATTESVRTLFGEAPIIEDLGNGRERWVYLESHVRSVSWLIVSGYLIYKPTNTLVYNAALAVTFKDGDVEDVLFVRDGAEK